MKVRLKYRRLRAQWAKLLIVNPKLCMIVLIAIWKSEGRLYITHIYRTKKTQRKFYPKEPNKVSVHQLWRGVDLGVKQYGLTKLADLVRTINEAFPYGKDGYQTALPHTIGRGMHLHLQTRTKS